MVTLRLAMAGSPDGRFPSDIVGVAPGGAPPAWREASGKGGRNADGADARAGRAGGGGGAGARPHAAAVPRPDGASGAAARRGRGRLPAGDSLRLALRPSRPVALAVLRRRG